jgi:arginyl-tRNA synthetase
MKYELFNETNLQVSNFISCLLKDKLDIHEETQIIYKLLNPPPKKEMGDLAFPCFKYAKQLKKSPAQISALLEQAESSIEQIVKIQAFGPYLNVFINHSVTAKALIEGIQDNSFFEKTIVIDAPKTMIEYSQPNTHKELHVGHMRNLCFGDALVKLYRYAGVEIISSTFPGDVGTHVAKCLWYFKKFDKEKEIPTDELKGAWLGTLYTKANNLLEDERGSDKEESNRLELTKILQELHKGSGEYFDLWKTTRLWSIDLMKKVYNWAGVTFDHWYWESDVDASSVALIHKYLEKGLFKKDQGAVGIDLSDDKLGFCLLLKSDGTGLYATKDIELARRKFDDFKVEQSLYVVDNRQALHFKQVFKTLEKMGFENAKNCKHLQYEMVELTDGAMSSRKGNIVALGDLIQNMENTVKENYLNKYQGQWQNEEIDSTAKIIASGAIKYGMNKIDSNKKIVFDMQDWLKLDGESGPYIQYVYARINSMLAKADYTFRDCDYSELKEQSEFDILNQLNSFNSIIQTCLEQNKTYHLCHYLYQLAKLYNSFYADCPILKQEDNLKQIRLNLSSSVAITIKKGLELLGIEAPQKM